MKQIINSVILALALFFTFQGFSYQPESNMVEEGELFLNLEEAAQEEIASVILCSSGSYILYGCHSIIDQFNLAGRTDNDDEFVVAVAGFLTVEELWRLQNPPLPK